MWFLFICLTLVCFLETSFLPQRNVGNIIPSSRLYVNSSIELETVSAENDPKVFFDCNMIPTTVDFVVVVVRVLAISVVLIVVVVAVAREPRTLMSSSARTSTVS